MSAKALFRSACGGKLRGVSQAHITVVSEPANDRGRRLIIGDFSAKHYLLSDWRVFLQLDIGKINLRQLGFCSLMQSDRRQSLRSTAASAE